MPASRIQVADTIADSGTGLAPGACFREACPLPMTVLDVLQRSTAYLGERGVESARLNSELILSHVLEKPRLRLYLEFDREVPEPALSRARELVRRRGQREPLQHLTGTTGFLGLDLRVTPAVLVPRPETELLAQLATERLRSAPSEPPRRALDLGTGSGCLAIALAVAVPDAAIHAIDLSPEALEVARDNAVRNQAERIQFHCGDGFAGLPEGTPPFDVLVTNPPYIPTADIASLEPEVRDHEPRLALDGGVDGLDFYRRLSREAGAWVRPGGSLLAEFGDGQAPALANLFISEGWTLDGVEKDLSGRERVLIVRPPSR